ncbi:hypothetical protein [Nocardia sp. NPDC049707]|uniref:hypothetical protein n=1 Tax=Nocardia sp. NPDC049707 TaxID=3154735 RepID=UPI0034299591
MSDTREALVHLLYEHQLTGRVCMGCRACPDLEFMNSVEHAEHVADLIAKEFAVTPHSEIGTDLHTLRIYGASDDLLELEDYIHDEYEVYRPTTLVLTAPSGAQLAIEADFCPVGSSLTDVGDGWVLTVQHADPAWTYPVRLNVRPDRDSDPAIELDVPEGTSILLWGEDDD